MSSLALVHDFPSPRQNDRERLHAVVQELRNGNRRANEARLAALLAERLVEDAGLLQAAAAIVVAAEESRERQRRAAPSPRERARRQEETGKVIAQAKAQIILTLASPCPNGKQLRYALGSELREWAAAGAAYAKIAAHVPDDRMTGEVLVESDLAGILAA